MKKFHITKQRFLQWYFSEDYTEESQAIREELAELVIKQLFKNNTSIITTNDIFENANKEAIKVYYLEEFDENDDYEVGDIKFECEIVLIEN